MKEQPQQRKLPLEILLWILKILIPLAVLLPVVYFSYSLVQGRLEDLANRDTEGYFSGTGLYLFASHILLFAICVGDTLVSAIGLLVASRYRSCPAHVANVRIFRWMLAVPWLTEVFYWLICLIVMQIG